MFKSNRKAIRIGSRALALTGAAAAAALAVGATTSHASSHNADPSSETTVSTSGKTLPAMGMRYVPRLICPADNPYLLNQQYNKGSGFRIMPGVEFSGYNWGFDTIAESSVKKPITLPNGKSGEIRTGISGDEDRVFNTATYWAFSGETGWTVTIHCTSDPNKGQFTPNR